MKSSNDSMSNKPVFVNRYFPCDNLMSNLLDNKICKWLDSIVLDTKISLHKLEKSLSLSIRLITTANLILLSIALMNSNKIDNL